MSSWKKKGKGISAGDDGPSPGKRKRDGDEDDKVSRWRKKTHPSVLQFFEDSAFEVDDENDSDCFYDFFNDEFETDVKVKSESDKAPQFPVFPKEEEMTEEEHDKMMEERYKPGSSFVRYAEDGSRATGSAQRYILFQHAKEPTIWKVKCVAGRERHSAFCLMQKFVDLHALGNKLQIISAFSVEHVNGFIFIEADKQGDIYEACKGICSIYFTRVAPVPTNEVSHLFSIRPKYSGISVGTWARVKSGKYKGDLAKVVTVNEAQRKATVKLIPRIDMQAMTAKFDGGVSCKKTAIPTPRLISSNELEDFRPLIQCRRDRDTGNIFEVFDGMMLKDGYLYKKVSLDSLIFWGVLPSKDELLKFEPPKNDGSNDTEWLSGLFGERKKKQTISSEKGEGSSGSGTAFYQKHDLVFFGETGFGVVIGTKKDERCKVLKEDSEGPTVVTVELRLLKRASFDKKFTALDQHMKAISIGDTIRVLEGPLEDKQGIVKQIYRGTIFLYDENEHENGGYSCTKAQICEKVEHFGEGCKQKGGRSEASGFEDFSSSPKYPLSPKKPWQARDNNSINREEKDGMFSVGQSLRIRVGPLKGYLCRVLAIRRTDITVKLDSKQKILAVKAKNLSEVREKSSAVFIGEDLNSAKPFELLGSRDGIGGCMDGAGTSTEGGGWNTGGLSTERSSWSSFPASSFSLQPESSSENPDFNKDVGASAWETKATPCQNSSWGAGATVAEEKAVVSTEHVGGWGKTVVASTGFGVSCAPSWGAAKMSTDNQASSLNETENNWGSAKLKLGSSVDTLKTAEVSWGNNKNASTNHDDGWRKSEESSWGKGKTDAKKTHSDLWGKRGEGGSSQSTWGGATKSLHGYSGKRPEDDSWGKLAEKSSSKDGSGGRKSARNSCKDGSSADQTDIWGSAKKDGENTKGWGKGGSDNQDSWSKSKASGGTDGGSSWSKPSGGEQDGTDSNKWGRGRGGGGIRGRGGGRGGGRDNFGRGRSFDKDQSSGNTSSWGGGGGSWGNSKVSDGDKKDEAGATGGWNKPKVSTDDGGSSWTKKDGGSSWNKQGGGSSWNKPKASCHDNGSSWGKQSGGSTWGKPSGGDQDGPDKKGNRGSSEGGRGGRGFGGRKGRGGDRGGRDSFGRGGRGRSYNRDQSTRNVSSWGGSGRGLGGGGWGNNKAFDGGYKEGGSSWSKQNDSGNDKGFGGGGDFEGGRGSGGRRGGRVERGQGGRRGGGRNNFGRGGRTFDREQSCGWSSGGQAGGGWGGNNKASDGGGSGGQDSWNKPKTIGSEGGSSWNNKGGGGSSFRRLGQQ